MFKLLGETTIDNQLLFLYKRAGRMYYSFTNYGKETESGDIKPIIENLKLSTFANSL